MSKKIVLPKIDQDFLENIGLPYRLIPHGGSVHLVLSNVGINPKYYLVDGITADKPVCQLMMKLPPGYPNSQIDMTYFYPALKVVDSRRIRNVGVNTGFGTDGNAWQMWSRHRTGESTWDPRRDCIATHLMYTDSFLKREVSDLIEKNARKKFGSTFPKKEEGMLIFPRSFEAKTDKPVGGRLVINFKR